MKKLIAFAGFIGGALFGLMFANKSGKQLRDEIQHSKDEEVLPRVGKELMEAGKNFVSAVKGVAEGPVEDMIVKGKRKGQQLIRNAQKNLTRAQKTAVKKISSVPVIKEYVLKAKGARKAAPRKKK